MASIARGVAATAPVASTDILPTLLVVTSAAESEGIAAAQFTRVAAHTTRNALRSIAEARPRVLAIDWDAKDIDGPSVCAAARQSGCAILMITCEPGHVPAALKAGCHAVLLRPFAPNLLAARLGRLGRQLPVPTAATALRPLTMPEVGTNHVWPDAQCPSCDEPGAVSFEFSSYRRMWYACLSCDHVWLGARRE